MNIVELINILKSADSPVKNYTWTVPPDLKLGILSTSQAFLDAKITRSSPNLIAGEIKSKLEKFITTKKLQVVVNTAGPYVNLDLTPSGWADFIQARNQFELQKKDQQVLIDYFSPNVGKKMHVGHIRSADIGESLRRILSLKYQTVISNNHLGDWGIQFGMIIWGLKHYKVEISELDNEAKIQKFYEIYVNVNQEIDQNPDIKTQVGIIAKVLENRISQMNDSHTGDSATELNSLEIEITLPEILVLWELIINVSLSKYFAAEQYLNLNKSNSRLNYPRITGLGKNWSGISQSQFSVILGEDYYVPWIREFTTLSLNFPEIFIKEIGSPAIYVDLEAQSLGRCYLISSEGYSLYHSRDIIARFVWAGLLSADKMLTLADNRQAHSFKQVFAIIQKILDLGIYEHKPFGKLTLEETKIALETLKKYTPEHVSFGFMTLPDGAMSTRKGKIVAFDELKETLEARVRSVLGEKGSNDSPEQIRKVAVASLKWVDLFRDRDQDIVFDFNQFLNFEGNTGVYQLYTLARLNSILEKNNYISKSPEIALNFLNSEEILILKEIYTLTCILENIVDNYRPHLLCTHLYQVATKINSWYAKFSVTAEADLARKQSLLELCSLVKNHLEKSLELLGIEPISRL